MILQFTGNWPWWTLLLPATLMCAGTIWIYRRHNLPAPWKHLLPALRILAVLCLLLSLLRPIIARVRTETVRGRIPLIIDDSGSMSLKEQYEPEEAVKVAWDLTWFPRRLRVTAFESPHETFTNLSPALNDALAAVREALAASADDQRRAWRNAENITEHAAGQIERLLRETDRTVERSGYLAAAETIEDTSEDTDSPEFSILYARWRHTLEALKQSVSALAAEAAELRKTERGKPVEPAEDIAARTVESVSAWDELAVLFPEMQIPADRMLAAAQIPEVDSALERLAQTTRWQIALHVLTDSPPALLRRLASKGEVDLFLLNEELIEPISLEELAEIEPRRPNTRMGTMLHKILQNYENEPLAAMAVITDGQINAGLPLTAAREIAVERKLPLIALGIGSEEPPKDIAIESVVVPETAFKGDQVKARIVVHRYGFEDREIPLTIRRGGRVMHEHTIPPGSSPRVTVETAFEEDEDGEHRYVIETPDLEGEAFEENNRRTFQVRVLEDRIKTLLVDEFPRWESRYLRMMLSRDRRVELDTVFIASAEDGRLERKPGAWPASREELFAYQTIIIGDVNPDHFSERELHDLHDFVFENGGTLIIMAGPHHMPERYAGTPLAAAFPFQRETTARPEHTPPAKAEGTAEYRIKLTAEGQYDTLPQISRDNEMSWQLWQRLPGVNWVATGIRTVPAADILAVTEDDERPVLLRGYAGAGRVLFLGADTFWRWRDRTRWHYHHRFWGQIMLWSAVGRTTGSDRFAKIISDRPRYAPDETVMVNVRLLDEDQVPIENAQAVLDIIDENDERIREAPLLPAAAGAGEYRAEITGLPQGHFTLIPRVFELRDHEVNAALEIEVGDVLTGEYIHLALDRARLEQWADNYQPLTAPLDCLEAIEPIEFTEEHRREFEQPVHALLLMLAAIALGAEWHLRKRCRLP